MRLVGLTSQTCEPHRCGTNYKNILKENWENRHEHDVLFAKRTAHAWPMLHEQPGMYEAILSALSAGKHERISLAHSIKRQEELLVIARPCPRVVGTNRIVH